MDQVRCPATRVRHRHAGWAWLLIAANLLAPARADDPPSDPPPEGTLYLRNNDYLPGHALRGDDPRTLRWQSPLFREPIDFQLEGVERIVYGESAQSSSSPPHARFVLRDGRSLFGQLVAMDQDQLTIQSQRHGRFGLKRQMVDRMESLAGNPFMLLDGLAGMQVWQSIANSKLDQWKFEQGKLTTNSLGANLLHDHGYRGPIVVDLELDLVDRSRVAAPRVQRGFNLLGLFRPTAPTAKSPPEFLLTLASGPDITQVKDGVSIEIWQQELVCHQQSEDEFKATRLPASKFHEAGSAFCLQAYFDPANRRLELYCKNVPIGRFDTAPLLGDHQTCIFLRNNIDTDLSIRRLRVRKWNGQLPSSPQQGDEFVRVNSGEFAAGKLLAIDESTQQLTVATADGTTRQLPLADIDVMQFPPGQASTNPLSGNVLVAYADGSVVNGDVTEFADDGLVVTSELATTPMRLAYRGATSIGFRFDDPSPATAGNGLFETKGGRLHGQVARGTDVDQLRWQPAYSSSSVRVDLSKDGEISFGTNTPESPLSSGRDELHLTNGDVIPCRVVGIDAQQVYVQLDGDRTTSLDRQYLKAVRLNHETNLALGGFGDPAQWKALNMTAFTHQMAPRQVVLSGRGALSREVQLPERGRMRFNLQWEKDGLLLIGLGASTEHQPRTGSPHCEFMLSRAGNLLRAYGTIVSPSRLGLRFGTAGQVRRGSISVTGSTPIQMEILFDRVDGQYSVSANGVELFRWRDSTNSYDGDRVFFLLPHVQDLYTGVLDQEFYTFISPHQRNPANASTTVQISDVEICRWAGVLDEDSRQRLLTRPRGARPIATSHLLRAINGDTLRGHLVSVEKQQVLFQTRLETLAIDRTQVAEIISLNNTMPASADSITARLHRGGLMSFDKVTYASDGLIGDSAILGQHRVPWESIASFKLAGRDKRADSPLLDWTLREPIPLPAADDAAATPAAPPSPLLGQPAADFELQTVSGGKVRLNELRGKVVILDFWATWCGPCLAAMPQVMEVAEQFKDRDTVLIALNQQEDANVVQGFLTARQWQLQVALDQQGDVARQYGVQAIPQTVIIDRQGVIQAVHVGAAEDLKLSLSREIEAILAK